MSTETPLVSIITPCHNSSKTLSETIQSVLNQTYTNWELILIDDQSRDNTFEIMQQHCDQDQRIKLIKNSHNLGVANTRNAGIDISRGELIAFLDSDDLWEPQKLQLQIDEYKKGANFIISDYSIINEHGNFLKEYRCPPNTSLKELLKGSFIGCLTVMVSRDILSTLRFKKIFHEDYLLWLLVLQQEKANLSVIRTPLARYRKSSNSLSSKKHSVFKHQWMIYRKELKINFYLSLYYFFNYALRGLRKHYL